MIINSTMKKERIVFQQSNIVTDENGEVKSAEHNIVRKITPESFMQVYLQDLSGMFKIETKTELRLLSLLWKQSEFHREGGLGNYITVVKAHKKQWAKYCECSEQTISNTIAKLTKKDLLLKGDRSVYYLNPKYFFKGALSSRDAVIKLHYQLKDNPDQEEIQFPESKSQDQ